MSGLLSFLGKAQQYISVDTSTYNAEQLVKDIFIGSQNASCITVDNISVSGWDFGNGDLSYGYFNRNGSSFEVNDGILLSSGKVSEAVGSFAGIQSADASGWSGDQDLERAARISNTTNATVLEFDFISNQSNKISFDYMFLSEQYLRNNDPGTCGYTDGFAFLIRKSDEQDYTNLAILPGTNTPITSNNVRGSGGKCPANNAEYFGHYNPDYSPLSFNGQTAILTAKTDVVPGVKYHIKLVIADQGNGLYDSGVILRAGSFTGNINIGNDLTIDNENPFCENQTYTIAPNPPLNDLSAQYYWYKDGVALAVPVSQNYYNVTAEGFYNLEVIMGSGCKLQGNVNIEKAPKPDFDTSDIMVCDSNFDGNHSAKLSNFTSQIVRNFQRGFEVSYYTNPSATGTPINPDSDFIFSQNPQTLYVKVSAFGCTPEIKPVKFYYGNKLSFKNYTPFEVCDNTLSGSKQINLTDYVSLITNETNVNPYYYATENQAKAGGNSTISNNQTISSDKTFYIRIERGDSCPNYAAVKFIFKQPKKSTVLKDEIICPGSVVTLDAGFGFDSYLWSNGETSQTVTVPVGDYFVDLGFNGCVYKQPVKVTEAELPKITNIEVSGNTATVFVTGGNPPYQYSLDGITYQSSNVFTNVPRGVHTAYVKDSVNCNPVQEDFLILNLINVITPNGDGKNDVLDYSDLKIKNNVSIEIFNKYGNLVFASKDQQFIWDGKTFGRPVSTGTYWYILKWTEPQTDKPVLYTGWILVKNRD